MLGLKMGTGGSSGYFYLMSTAEVTRPCLRPHTMFEHACVVCTLCPCLQRHQIFRDFCDLSTFLIPKYDSPACVPVCSLQRRCA